MKSCSKREETLRFPLRSLAFPFPFFPRKPSILHVGNRFRKRHQNGGEKTTKRHDSTPRERLETIGDRNAKEIVDRAFKGVHPIQARGATSTRALAAGDRSRLNPRASKRTSRRRRSRRQEIVTRG
ncbi:hypothetical protein NL676_002336 [Syzygium grande]|nr:hypothetical protein NL676_002336 [Syzygium grande]